MSEVTTTSWKGGEVIQAEDLNSYEALKNEISLTNSTVTSHSSQITSINTDITSIRSNITNLTAMVTNNTTVLSNLSSTVIDLLYPIGSLYFTSNGLFNPNNEWTGTKWMRFAKGRTIFGVANSGTFNENGLTGGSETHTLIEAEMPEHAHSFTYSYRDTITTTQSSKKGSGGGINVFKSNTINNYTSSDETGTIGNNQSFSILPPYITTYIWKRIPLTYIFTEAPGLQYDDTTNVISWSYVASSGVTIEYAVNDSEYSTVMPTYIYSENDTDVVFYIKGSLDDYSEITSASLPAHIST